MNEYTIEEFNAAMKTSREYSTGVTVSKHLIKIHGANKIIGRIVLSYKSAEEFSSKYNKKEFSPFNCMIYVKETKDAGDHLIAAMHEGLINCVDGKFTINKEKLK